uniref:(northern house mosquito) hypothetical protein n=1 Tax=Culex pipiens TaxID=7175 RepID=A0A8D8FNR1_CULPI
MQTIQVVHRARRVRPDRKVSPSRTAGLCQRCHPVRFEPQPLRGHAQPRRKGNDRVVRLRRRQGPTPGEPVLPAVLASRPAHQVRRTVLGRVGEHRQRQDSALPLPRRPGQSAVAVRPGQSADPPGQEQSLPRYGRRQAGRVCESLLGVESEPAVEVGLPQYDRAEALGHVRGEDYRVGGVGGRLRFAQQLQHITALELV